MFATLIIGLMAGPRRVLVGVAHRVARDRGRMGGGALPAVRPVLYELLGVVPRAAARRHRHGGEEAHHDDAHQQSAQRPVGDEPDHQRNEDRDQRGQDHLPLGGPRHDADALGVIGTLRASMIPGFSRNWRRTSSTTPPPARPTDSIARAANRYTIIPPSSRPISTGGSPIPKVRSVPRGPRRGAPR